MNKLLISATVITSILNSCSLFSNEPTVDQMTNAVAKWQKVEASTILNFSKGACEPGRISYLYTCAFEMTLKNGVLSEKYPVTQANFVSHDSGENWLAYP